ncbi:MAG: invasion protein [Tardiphaga sp.]|nr:invasion protein [Tardiphaga sp.]
MIEAIAFNRRAASARSAAPQPDRGSSRAIERGKTAVPSLILSPQFLARCLDLFEVAEGWGRNFPPIWSNPERTTASFGDWVVRCEIVGTPAKRICEVAQIITVQGQGNPIAQIAIGKPEPTGGKQLTLVLPANVAFAVRPQINIAKAGTAPSPISDDFGKDNLKDHARKRRAAMTETRIQTKSCAGRPSGLGRSRYEATGHLLTAFSIASFLGFYHS